MIYTLYSTVRFFYDYCTRNRQQTRVQTVEVEMNAEVLQQAIEKKLGSKLYKDLKDQKNYESQCVICLEQFEAETKVRETHCYHVFHKECIDLWLAKYKVN